MELMEPNWTEKLHISNSDYYACVCNGDDDFMADTHACLIYDTQQCISSVKILSTNFSKTMIFYRIITSFVENLV